MSSVGSGGGHSGWGGHDLAGLHQHSHEQWSLRLQWWCGAHWNHCETSVKGKEASMLIMVSDIIRGQRLVLQCHKEGSSVQELFSLVLQLHIH